MREEMLKQLVDKTFEKLACPVEGYGVYAEIQQALLAAYDLGSRKDNLTESLVPVTTGS